MSDINNPYGQAPPPAPYAAHSGDPDKRPGTVTAAAVISILFSAISALLFGALTVAFLVARDGIVDAIDDEVAGQSQFEDFSAADIADVGLVVMGILTVWCLIALVLAVLALRRQNWARITLVISAAVSAVLSLLSFAAIFPLVTLIAAIATIVLFFTGGANDWYSRKGNPAPY